MKNLPIFLEPLPDKSNTGKGFSRLGALSIGRCTCGSRYDQNAIQKGIKHHILFFQEGKR